MRLLCSNDDGYDAPGLQALVTALEADGHDLWVSAPETEQSGRSHALTFHEPLRARERKPRHFAVSGTPADSVYVALHGLLETKPEVVLSGINRGSNLGSDVNYSGTVAAAREAAMSGYPSIAVSMHLGDNGVPDHWETAAAVAVRVLHAVAERGLPKHTLLNVNVPDVPLAELRGIRPAALGDRFYDNKVLHRQDPFGRSYYWIGGSHVAFSEDDSHDGPVVEQGYASVTPLHIDPTHTQLLEALGEWF